MSEKERIVIELRRAWGGEAWHGPALSELLAGVTATTASTRPIPTAHTIWELVLHLRSWAREVTRRITGGEPAEPEDGDWPSVLDHGETAWQEAVSSLRAAHENLVAEVGKLPVRALDRVVGDTPNPAGVTSYSVRQSINGIVQHHAYHAGQIALLKKAAAG